MGMVYSWLTTASFCDRLGAILLPQNRGPCWLLYGTLLVWCVQTVDLSSCGLLSSQVTLLKRNSNDEGVSVQSADALDFVKLLPMNKNPSAILNRDQIINK